jgi:glycosyl transferase family 25
MQTILINLDCAEDRRRHMLDQLAQRGIEAERVGVDFRHATAAEIDAWTAAHGIAVSFDLRAICAAEAGCWASHLRAWQLLEQGSHRECVILEDDIVLGAGFASALVDVRTQNAYDVVYLGTSSKNISTRRRSAAGSTWLHEPLGVIFNTWGYVIRRSYAERFFAALPLRIDMPIDHFLGGRARVAKPRIAVLRPAVVAEDPRVGLQSQIQPYATRSDRHPAWQAARRAILGSRVSDLYYALYRWL